MVSVVPVSVLVFALTTAAYAAHVPCCANLKCKHCEKGLNCQQGEVTGYDKTYCYTCPEGDTHCCVYEAWHYWQCDGGDIAIALNCSLRILASTDA